MTAFAELEKVANAKWRLAQNLVGVGKRMFSGLGDELAGGVNLAGLKQQVGAGLRAPGTSPISQRMAALQKAQLAAERAALGGDDDLIRAWSNSRKATSHDRFFSRHGQKQPHVEGHDASGVIGDRLYRGTVGGNPWGGGTYNGAFHYASPSKGTAYTYTGIPAPALKNSLVGAGDATQLSAVHHYQAAPGQLYGRGWAPEDILASTRKTRGEAVLRPQSPGTPLSGGVNEAALLKQHNPYLGTEIMSGGAYNQAGTPHFFPAGRAASAAQNYMEQMSKMLKSSPGGGLERFGAQAKVTTTPWSNSIQGNGPLQRLLRRDPGTFDRVMSRRANKWLAPQPGALA
jgi:hypothetical protein